jgi:putative FmdB family regulatory protein
MQYEFTCKRCGEAFEVLTRGFIKEHQRVCPECGSEDVRQKFTSFLRNGPSKEVSGCGPSRSGFG